MAASGKNVLFGVYFCYLLLPAFCRIHHIKVENDERPKFTMSTFGFLKQGTLSVNVTNFDIPLDVSAIDNSTFGFTLDVSSSTGESAFMEDFTDKCIFKDKITSQEDEKNGALSIVLFRMDLQNKKIFIERRGTNLRNLHISQDTSEQFWKARRAADLSGKNSPVSDSSLFKHNSKTKREAIKEPLPAPGSAREPLPAPGSADKYKSNVTTALEVTTRQVPNVTEKEKGGNTGQLLMEIPMTVTSPAEMFNFFFMVAVTTDEEEGMYNLNFHNCLTFIKPAKDAEVSFMMDLVEVNDGNFLSAGQMPLPMLYFVLALVYLALAVIWNTVLCKSNKESVYKMHYLMMAVVFVKSLSCLLHMINYHFIKKEGIREEAWAVIFYIAYLTRGALLFITIILIGSGWAFIKYMLSDREKKLFVIVIPLQILDNIAWIIVEESEEAKSQYTVWKEIFILIDLLCCGAILFPVVWSIRHLQEASRADGKAELSLTKLKLFRQFYILVVCYIYFTRIIVYLLNMTVPFKYQWLNELFRELATVLFFIVTGYKFKPAPDNPYLQVPQDSDEEEDIEMDTVIVGESSTVGSLKKVNQAGKSDQSEGLKLRESSHEYD